MRLRFAASLAAVIALPATAQDVGSCSRGTASQELTTDRLSSRLFNNGSLYFGGNSQAEYYVDGASALFAAGIWVGGRVAGTPRVAAATYSDFEFWPGPLAAGGLPVDPSDCSAYDRIYAVTQQDLDDYEAGGVPTADLSEWPVALGAPVVDGDGIAGNYDLEAGDRPDVQGDATAFWIMNDAGNIHFNTGSTPLGIEVRVVAFVAGADSYYRIGVTNRSGQTIDDLRVAYWSDPDLGDASDDYVGSDPSLDMAYVYNADNFDGGGDFGGFGEDPPAVGAVILSGAGSVGYAINASALELSDPADVGEFDNVLNGLTPTGAPYTVGGLGIGTGTPTAYVFSGDPITGAGWSEVSANNPASDRRMTITSTPQTLAPGFSRTVDVAVLYGRGDDHLLSVAALKARAASVASAYASGDFFPQMPLASEEAGPASAPGTLGLASYPNPAAAEVTLAYTLGAASPVRLRVFDVLGREVAVAAEGVRSADRHRSALDVSALPAGVYVAVLEVEGVRESVRFTVAR